MIASLRGTIQSICGEQVVIDVGGVGYEVTAGTSVLANLSAATEAEVVVYTDVKENAIVLYGFSSPLEKQVFLLLKKVKGIGSRLALTILSAVGAELLLSRIAHGDASALENIPGIGRKTASRLIVELREHVAQFIEERGLPLGAKIEKVNVPAETERAGGREPDIQADAVLALEKLGFTTDKARRAVTDAWTSLANEIPVEPPEAGLLVQLALTRMS